MDTPDFGLETEVGYFPLMYGHSLLWIDFPLL